MNEGTRCSGNYTFRGVEYAVGMEVTAGNTLTATAGNTLIVEVEDKHTADQWRGSFDSAYLEDLTHKTGNYKQFQIFISMLESAISQTSESVSLDLLTYSDLESLRSRKTGGPAKTLPTAPRNPSLNSKRYLILTYTVEFDRIHYPLPLPYVGKPDPRALQETIRQLREEVRSLQQKGTKFQGTRDHRLKELEKTRKDYDRLLQEKEEIEASFLDFRREVQNTAPGSAAKEVRILKDLVKHLEQDLLSAQTKHQRAASRRSHEYRLLVDELDEVKASERNLKARVKSLTNELAIYKRRGPTSRSANMSAASNRGRHSTQNSLLSNGYSSRENSYAKDNSRVSSRYSTNNSFRNNKSLERSRERSLSRERSRSRDHPAYLRERSLPRERSVSRDRSNSRDRLHSNTSAGSGPLYNRNRSTSPAGISYPRFDPTSYIKEKDRKRKEAESKQKRTSRGRLPGNYERKSRPSPNNSIGRLSRGSRASSVSSFRSRTSSVESLSDAGLASDASNGRNRKTKKVMKPAKTLNAWSSPDVSFNSKPNGSKPPAPKSKKILSSTPESTRTRRKATNKENLVNSDAGADSDYFDRSSEIGEIDARLNRLQQFMKNNL